MKTDKKPLYVLCYRQGTPCRYKWTQTLITGTSHADLADDVADVERMGYQAHIMPANRLASGQAVPRHGLPESYSAKHQASEVLHDVWAGGWLADSEAYDERKVKP